MAAVLLIPFELEPTILQEVVDIAHCHCTLVVFNETRSGFRVVAGGVQRLRGVWADLGIFSKAMANGYAVSAVAGSADLLAMVGRAHIGSIYQANSPATAAVVATINQLADGTVLERVRTLGGRLQGGLVRVVGRHGLPARVHGDPYMPFLLRNPRPRDKRADTKGALRRSHPRGVLRHTGDHRLCRRRPGRHRPTVAVCDAAVAGATGPDWYPNSQKGRQIIMATILVTGASSGIGAAAAVQLARQGHRVVITGRSRPRLEATHRRVTEAARTAGVSARVPAPIPADLARLGDVRRLAAAVLELHPELDVLVNNAGIQPHRRQVTPDGYELTLAVNHLAAMLLSCLLAERLRSRSGRIVTTASSSHAKGVLDLDDLQLERGWNPSLAYGRSKLANILFTREAENRLGVPATSFHPGVITTEINRDSRWGRLLKPLERFVMESPDKGADTLVWLATGEEGAAPSADYYYRREAKGTSPTARESELPGRLWDASARLAGMAV
ncbi:SDR family NAD(P)-dependent oxidoreductase [Streptomyces sp. NPDC059853]|uniref:SDR family NAD(P)-dependent oxidoreductase n=1 Tax=Streptomyces sp. NPDC059853 TaxID=3346973 RepID=UPI0036475233